MYLDLDELDRVFNGYWLWSTKWFNLAWHRRGDYFGDKKLPLHETVRNLVEERTGQRPTGPIRLLTHLRYFGYIFNPVSYYYCFDSSGSKVETIVAEITNTPWKQRHCYVIQNVGDDDRIRARHAKDFHVSPFMPMDLEYQWNFSQPGEKLEAAVVLYKERAQQFSADMKLERLPISSFNLIKQMLAFPCMTAKVTFAIYWQALRLKMKKTPYYAHPNSLPKAYNGGMAEAEKPDSVSSAR